MNLYELLLKSLPIEPCTGKKSRCGCTLDIGLQCLLWFVIDVNQLWSAWPRKNAGCW